MSLSTFNYTKYTSEGLAYISNLKFIMGHYSVFVMTNIRKKKLFKHPFAERGNGSYSTFTYL